MTKIIFNLKDIKNKEDYMERKQFIDKIERVIEFVKQNNFTEAAKLMLKEDISLVFLNQFTIRLKTIDLYKLGDEMINLSKK